MCASATDFPVLRRAVKESKFLYRTVTAKNTDQDDGRGNRYYGCGNAVSLVWGQKAPSKHENGGKKRPQNHKVGAESAPAQIRAEKSVGAKSAVKMQKWGQKAPSKQQSDGKKRHHSDKREKSHGGGKCHQNGKVVAENATKTVK